MSEFTEADGIPHYRMEILRLKKLHEDEIQLSDKRLKEMQDLKRANSDLAAAAICPDDCTPDAIRWQVAREIIKMIVKQQLCHDDEILLILAIREKFGLEI